MDRWFEVIDDLQAQGHGVMKAVKIALDRLPAESPDYADDSLYQAYKKRNATDDAEACVWIFGHVVNGDYDEAAKVWDTASDDAREQAIAQLNGKRHFVSND
jgi:hypothetical protein